jgi:hypothetical protein
MSLIASSTVLITDGSPEALTRTSAGSFIDEGPSTGQPLTGETRAVCRFKPQAKVLFLP